MKTKKILGTLCLFLSTFIFINCSDKNETIEIHHLSFEKDYYERPLIGAKSIMIRGGNRDYSIKIEDPSVVDVKVD